MEICFVFILFCCCVLFSFAFFTKCCQFILKHNVYFYIICEWLFHALYWLFAYTTTTTRQCVRMWHEFCCCLFARFVMPSKTTRDNNNNNKCEKVLKTFGKQQTATFPVSNTRTHTLTHIHTKMPTINRSIFPLN